MTPAAARLALPLVSLDTLWLQVTGTRCNIACKHCFISCGPKVDTHALLSRQTCAEKVEQAAGLGVREVWFTGGEPFLHPEMLQILEHALEHAPVGVLTNGMLISEPLAERLGRLFRESRYNLEIRVSLDGATADSNDAIRGRGVFDAACLGIARLARAGLEPVLAVSVLDDVPADRDAFVGLLGELGLRRPRIKWIPVFRLGREATRGRAYAPWEVLANEDLAAADAALGLMCGTGRTITSEGVFPCPILINEPSFKLGVELEQSLGPTPVDHPACSTCWQENFSCST